MAEDWELQQERDDDLISRLAIKTNDFRGYLREWIISEIKDLQPKISFMLVAGIDEGVAKELRVKRRRIKEIEDIELQDHLSSAEEAYKSLKRGASSSAITDMNQLEDGIAALRGLVRELCDIRKVVYDAYTSTGD